MCLSVSPSPKFEPNQNDHNSVNFEARTSRFCMVVDLDEDKVEVDNNNEDEDDKQLEE